MIFLRPLASMASTASSSADGPDAGPTWGLCVGLEIHAPLATDSKLFSPAASPPPGRTTTTTATTTSAAAAAANRHPHPLDWALPGALPAPPNAEAARLVALAALSLNCALHPRSGFTRKHYNYLDLPSGYQVTQVGRRSPIASYLLVSSLSLSLSLSLSISLSLLPPVPQTSSSPPRPLPPPSDRRTDPWRRTGRSTCRLRPRARPRRRAAAPGKERVGSSGSNSRRTPDKRRAASGRGRRPSKPPTGGRTEWWRETGAETPAAGSAVAAAPLPTSRATTASVSTAPAGPSPKSSPPPTSSRPPTPRRPSTLSPAASVFPGLRGAPPSWGDCGSTSTCRLGREGWEGARRGGGRGAPRT